MLLVANLHVMSFKSEDEPDENRYPPLNAGGFTLQVPLKYKPTDASIDGVWCPRVTC